MGMNELSVSVGAGRRKQHRQGGQPTAGWSCFRAPLDSLLSGAVLQSWGVSGQWQQSGAHAGTCL